MHLLCTGPISKSTSNEIQMDSIFTNCLKSQSLELKLKPSLLILWRRTRSSIHSISLNEPSNLKNYFILLEPCPLINDMKAIIWMNTIKNNPVTTEDINITEKMFRPDISFLKGKTTCCKLVPVVKHYIEIPWELIGAQHSVTLCLDGMNINGIPSLTTISKNILYFMAQYVEKQAQGIYHNCLGQVFWVYNLGGFWITNACCVNEFCPLMDPLANEFQVKMNYANPQEHIPEANCNNRHLPLPTLQLLGSYHDQDSCNWFCQEVEFLPFKHGISKYVIQSWLWQALPICIWHLCPSSRWTRSIKCNCASLLGEVNKQDPFSLLSTNLVRQQ